MRVLSAAEVLDVWERGLHQSPTRRAVMLLAAACPESSDDDLVALPIGRRDARLLQLREGLFGPEMTIVAACPACGEHLESTFQVADVRLDADPPEDHPIDTIQTIAVDGYSVTFRLPTSSDLLALPTASQASSARNRLLALCLLDIRDANSQTVRVESLPDHALAAIAAQMATTDPQADVELNLACPTCDHRWQGIFDIASFLWQEIHVWAQRTLRDVHSLARVYGWREADVLALSPTRRQIYLELSRR